MDIGAVEYTRKLYDDVRSRYENADTKAQVVLAFGGAFLALLSGIIFSKPGDLREIVSLFSVWTWAMLALATLCLIGSIISAMICLWSRVLSARKLRIILDSAQRAMTGSPHYAPKVM